VDLKEIYLTSLRLCAPERLVQPLIERSMPHNVVAIGKCAGALLDGVAGVHDIADAFVAIPDGYRLPETRAQIHIGGHPQMTRASFDAGRALLAFVDAHDDLLFLISGGGSACVEVPLPPHTEDEVARLNAQLIASGMSIGAINAARRTVSAIKGGRLGARVRGRAIALVYSDVATNAWSDVASGPVHPDALIADNTTLVRTAAVFVAGGGSRADARDDTTGEARPHVSSRASARDPLPKQAVILEQQIEGDVEEAARLLAAHAEELRPGQILVAGGEPTVTIHGNGRGGRCCELAVRFAMHSRREALFGSSDGVDGNSGVAGIYLPPRASIAGTGEWQAALGRSDSLQIAAQLGEPIMIAAAGNNLRDLFLVARD
jgi:glycerate-2-kinase